MGSDVPIRQAVWPRVSTERRQFGAQRIRRMGRDVRAWVEAAVMACQIVARRPVFPGEFEAASSVNIPVKLTVGEIG